MRNKIYNVEKSKYNYNNDTDIRYDVKTDYGTYIILKKNIDKKFGHFYVINPEGKLLANKDSVRESLGVVKYDIIEIRKAPFKDIHFNFVGE